MSDTAACKNTDRELWREREGDYYSPSLHVTEDGGIGFDVGGNVVVKPIREWHRLAASEMAWRIMAKQEARYANLPLSEREAALQKALESTTTDQVKAEDEVERLRAALDKIAFYDDFMNKESAIAMLNIARDALGSYPVAD